MVSRLLIAFMFVTALALDASGQSLASDPSRDLALHTTIRAFLDDTIAANQLETDLRSYAREFEARPYKVGAATIDWEKVPQDRMFAVARAVSHITHPALPRNKRKNCWRKSASTAATDDWPPKGGHYGVVKIA